MYMYANWSEPCENKRVASITCTTILTQRVFPTSSFYLFCCLPYKSLCYFFFDPEGLSYKFLVFALEVDR